MTFNVLRYTGRSVGPIIAVNGSNDAPWRPSRLFMVSLIKKKYFPHFYPKM